MDTWDCTVTMPSGKIRSINVTAYCYSDAIITAESMTGGICNNAVQMYNSTTNNETSGDNSGLGILFLLVVVFCIAAWKYILLISGIAFVMWWLWKNWN